MGAFCFMAQRTDIHGPAATAPNVTGKYAVCEVCGTSWQIQSPNLDDARGCSFCDAPKEAITIHDEDES
jgi:hypothetical protein